VKDASVNDMHGYDDDYLLSWSWKCSFSRKGRAAWCHEREKECKYVIDVMK
jgi:hypothetical protein